VASYPAEQDSFNGSIRAVHVARDGSLWLGSYDRGLRHLREGKLTTYDSRHQLASNSAWAIHEDPNGVIWVGTEHGLARIEHGKVTLFNRNHGLGESIVNQVLEDDVGDLWLSGLRGIYRVRRECLDDIAAGRTNFCHVVTVGESDGMESAETNGENQPAGCKTRDGLLWFPTIKGVVVIDPKGFRDNSRVPPVIIEQMRVDNEMLIRHGMPAREAPDGRGATPAAGNALNESPRFRLAPGRARVLEVHYTATSLTAPERVRFKYRLEGHDPDWQDAGNRRVAIYTNLRPGDYRFQVIACNNHGYWNDIGAGFSFSLAPHFYQTWPFWLGCALAVVLVAAAIQASRLRTQRQFLRLQQQAELGRVRARIAEDMHEDIGASLSQIAILSEVARRDLRDSRRAEPNVERISGIARRLVDSLSELVWATNPLNDTLDNMVAYFREYAANYFEPTAMECRLDFPADLPALPVPAETRRALFLGFKEALHNVVKHSGARIVEVGLRLSPMAVGVTGLGSRGSAGDIHLFVHDDGRGLPPRKEGEARRFGNGLRNMRRRLEAVGGATKFQSGPGQGTRVAFHVPLRKAAV
jgi:signal transduction histidine kinase